jgi:hypothetical protein
MEEISIIQTIVNGGPAVLLAVACVILWRTWRSDSREHKKEVESLNQCLNELQEQRVNDAIEWSQKYNEMAGNVKQSIDVLTHFTGMVERALTQGGRDA